MNAVEVSEKIHDLYHVFSKTKEFPESIAQKINSILIHGDDVPLNMLQAGWNLFANQHGLNSNVERSGGSVCG